MHAQLPLVQRRKAVRVGCQQLTYRTAGSSLDSKSLKLADTSLRTSVSSLTAGSLASRPWVSDFTFFVHLEEAANTVYMGKHGRADPSGSGEFLLTQKGSDKVFMVVRTINASAFSTYDWDEYTVSVCVYSSLLCR